MLFSSLEFLLFLPIAFVLYWFVFNRDLKLQNFFVVLISYVFYGWWDPLFLVLLFISTLVDYLSCIGMSNTMNKVVKKRYLYLSYIVNLSLLMVFKYFDFFQESFVESMSLLGFNMENSPINLILPIGISFYTFQTLSYTIDVYRGVVLPSNNFLAFAAYVSFFPQLVAGPIERAKKLLPQFLVNREFSYNYAIDGCRQILCGFFKKIV